MQVLFKKKIIIIFLLFLLFAGLIALTQELEIFSNNDNDLYNSTSEWVMPVIWFRSNTGGMALEEIKSEYVALRNEYALAIIVASQDEMPDYLLPFFDESYLIEMRILYKNAQQIRTQWLFKDFDNFTRLNAVFLEPGTNGTGSIRGFIEIFDEKSLLISEYRFFEDGEITRIDYEFNDEILVSATFFIWVDGEDYIRSYADFYRYNRMLTLRSIERVFYRNMQADPIIVYFPRQVMEGVEDNNIIADNVYPLFFGDIFVTEGQRIVYDTDDRGRILTQTLYDREGKVIWVIRNTWQNNRIVLSAKTEGDTVLLTEYEYNANGDRILERNLKNGILERVVRTSGKTETEELYINNVVVLRAIWEDGEKISETRIRN